MLSELRKGRLGIAERVLILVVVEDASETRSRTPFIINRLPGIFVQKDYLFKKEDAEIVSQRLIKIVKELNTVFRSNPADQRIDGLFVDDRHFAIQKFNSS